VGVNSGQSPLGCVALTQLVAHSDGVLLQRVTRIRHANVLRRRNGRVDRSHTRFVAHSEILRAGSCQFEGPPALALTTMAPEHWQNAESLH